MAFFNWQPALETGIPEIDTQHRRLVELINGLHSAMSTGQARETLDGLVAELIDYTRTHFKTEEELMSRHGYPRLEEHRQLHLSFISQVLEFQQKLGAGQPLGAGEVMGFLKDWLFQHIGRSDRDYVSHCKN